MIYMDKDINYNAAITQAKYLGNKLMVGDILDIKVTGYDEIAIKPFNLGTFLRSIIMVQVVLLPQIWLIQLIKKARLISQL
jgi:hypothetical protein